MHSLRRQDMAAVVGQSTQSSVVVRNIPVKHVYYWLRPGIFPTWVHAIGRGPEYSLHGSTPLVEARNIPYMGPHHWLRPGIFPVAGAQVRGHQDSRRVAVYCSHPDELQVTPLSPPSAPHSSSL